VKHAEGFDQAAIEEDPAANGTCGFAIGERHLDRAAQERGRIDPWQRRAAARQLLLHDPATRLLDDGVPAARQLREQRRLAAARTAGDDDEAVRQVDAHFGGKGAQRGVASSHGLSVRTRRSEPSGRMTAMSP